MYVREVTRCLTQLGSQNNEEIKPSDTDMELGKILAQHKLPLIVSTNQPLTCDRKIVVRTHGHVLLYDTLTETRLKIMDNRSSRVYYLPLSSRQKFERLPSDPMFDDMGFETVKDVIQRCPTKLPDVLRCVQEFYTEELEHSVPLDECFDVHGVEEDSYGKQYLCGELQSNKQKLRMPAETITACFSTMPCEQPVHASELAKLKMPQRVRIIPILPDGVLVKREDLQVLTIQSVEDICFAIATSPDSTRLISIPTNIDFVNQRYKFSVLQTDKLTTQVLPSLAQLKKYLNLSLGITEVGISKVPSDWERVPVPLTEVLDQWKDSHEGREYAESINEQHIDYLKRSLSELDCTNRALVLECTEFKRNKRPIGTRAPAPPPRDDKSKSNSKPKPPPKPRRHSFSLRSRDPPLSSPVKLDARDDSDTYEYLTIGDLQKQPSGVPDYKVIADVLKETLTKKEKMIYGLKEEIGMLEKYKIKCQELENTHVELRRTITRLQNSVDADRNPDVLYSQLPSGETLLPPSYEDLGVCVPHSTGPGKIRSMTVSQVCDLLTSLGLQQYCDKFGSEIIDGSMLLHLDKEIMVEELGMRPLHAVRLISSIDS